MLKEQIYSEMFSFEDLVKGAQNNNAKCRNGLKMNQHSDKTMHRRITTNIKDYETEIKTMEERSKHIFASFDECA